MEKLNRFMQDSANPANANKITRAYLDSILIEERLIGSVKADIKMELFGESFDTPIMMPAFSHLDEWGPKDHNCMVDYAAAARELGAVNFVGMRENEKMDEIFETGARTVRIIKPYADRDKIFSQIHYAKDKGAIAVGMDIDHIFGKDGDYSVVIGELMAAQSPEMLREYVQAASPLPFVVKGVLSARDALRCVDCGAAAALVSHHFGRMPFAVPPLMVLPKIREAVGGKLKLFVDCGINSGIDAFKALALGADAVAVGRAMLPDLTKSGKDGAIRFIAKMNEELTMLMNHTGCKDLQHMDSTVLWFP